MILWRLRCGSSAIRLTLGAAAWIALGIAAVLLFQSEKQIMTRTASGARLRSARARRERCARRAAGVAAGLRGRRPGRHVLDAQGGPPRPRRSRPRSNRCANPPREGRGRRSTKPPPPWRSSAISTARAREYLKSGQPLMAGDVIFTEGGDAAATAARQVETARLAEHRAADVAEAAIRKRQAVTLGRRRRDCRDGRAPAHPGAAREACSTVTAETVSSPTVAAHATTPAGVRIYHGHGGRRSNTQGCRRFSPPTSVASAIWTS